MTVLTDILAVVGGLACAATAFGAVIVLILGRRHAEDWKKLPPEFIPDWRLAELIGIAEADAQERGP